MKYQLYPFPHVYRTGTLTGTGTLVFRSGLNTGRTGVIPVIPERIPNFGYRISKKLKVFEEE